MKRMYGLRFDPAFKRIYHQKKYLKKLMKDLFHEEVEDFYYDNVELPKDNVNLKSSVCDLVVRSKDRIMLLEVQGRNLKNVISRVKLYSSMLYVTQDRGNNYRGIVPVEVYLIVNYPFGMDKVLKEYEELETTIKEQFGNLSKIKIWNIRSALKCSGTIDYDYARLFTLDDEDSFEKGNEVIKELKGKSEFQDLVREIEVYHMDIKTYQELKEAEMMEMTFEEAVGGLQQEAYEDGEKHGISIGEKRGEKRGIKKATKEIVSNLLKVGVSPEIIAQATQLSEQQIKNYVSS